jgi:hypothetical protein
VKISKSETLGLDAEVDTCLLCSQPSDLGNKHRFVQTFVQTSSQKKKNNWKQRAKQGINNLLSCPKSPIIRNKLHFFRNCKFFENTHKPFNSSQ